jgi:rod shape determining protein RodA
MFDLNRRFRHFDWWLFATMLILMAIGVIVIYSALTFQIGDEKHTSNEYLKQITWIIVSLILFFIVILIPYPLFDLIIIPAYFISLAMLLVVLTMPQIKGATRWIMLGPFQLQPAEFAKITTILLLAKALAKPYITDMQILFRLFAIGAPPMLLLLMQPDLGSTVIFGVIIFAILAFSDLSDYWLILTISPFIAIATSFYLPAFIIFIVLLLYVLHKLNLAWITIGFTAVFNVFIYFFMPFIWNGLKEYQQNRILTFLDPTRDPLGAGYQAIQSRIAIGSGLFQGKGFLEGTQKSLNFLPERHTDFVFSVIAEEFGFIGSMLLILIFYFFIYRLIRSLKAITDKEQRLAIMGIIALFTSQITINIAINLGIFPTTGLPLPFISYGGSSLLANTLAIGIIMKYLTEKSFIR